MELARGPASDGDSSQHDLRHHDAVRAAYVASKWAVRGLTKAVALDLARDGIRVVSLHPGPIRTPMTDDLPREMPETQSLPRFGEPEEVAAMTRFLLCEATYTTGTEFVIDGGAIVGRLEPVTEGVSVPAPAPPGPFVPAAPGVSLRLRRMAQLRHDPRDRSTWWGSAPRALGPVPDPLGPANGAAIGRAARWGGRILCGWDARGGRPGRLGEVRRLLAHRSWTAGGQPCHLLCLAGDVVPRLQV